MTIASDPDFTKVIQETTTDFIAQKDKYKMNKVEKIALNVEERGTQKIVQELIGEMQIKFTPTTIIPGTDSNA